MVNKNEKAIMRDGKAWLKRKVRVFENKERHAMVILRSGSVEYFYTDKANRQDENYFKHLLKTIEEYCNEIAMLAGSGWKELKQ